MVAGWRVAAKRAVAVVLFVTTCGSVACDGGCVSVKEVEKRIYSIVSIGDSREEVAAAMDRAKVKVTYDQHDHQFRAAIFEGCRKLESIIVHLTFDELDKLKEVKVFKEITFW